MNNYLINKQEKPLILEISFLLTFDYISFDNFDFIFVIKKKIIYTDNKIKKEIRLKTILKKSSPKIFNIKREKI